MKKFTVLLVLIGLALPAAAATIIVPVDNDATVSYRYSGTPDDQSDMNFGSDPLLKTQQYAYNAILIQATTIVDALEGYTWEDIISAKLMWHNYLDTSSASTQMYQVTEAWSQDTVTWNTKPASAYLMNQNINNPVDGWVTQDVIVPVRNWVNGSFNGGLFYDAYVGNFYGCSSENETVSYRPYFEIEVVPEPATLSLLGLGLGFAMIRRRK